MKNKNTVSYKSVSEISEFEEYVDEEPSEFTISTKKDPKNSKSANLNESINSAQSIYSKDVFDEKEEDENSEKKKMP